MSARRGRAITRHPFVTALVVLVLAGCASSGDGAPSPSPSTPAPVPTSTLTPTPTPTPQSLPLTLYYVAIGDEGASGDPIGCGDSLVSVTTAPVLTSDLLRASIERLLSDTDRHLGQSGLTTSLADGTLRYVAGDVQNGVVTVELTGQPFPAGVCDNPRIIAQLEQTALAATDATQVRILIDGEPLADVLSLK